jgi:peptidoglycan-associated lipoprotein
MTTVGSRRAPADYQEGIVMDSQQGAPGGSWALRSLVIVIGMAGLLAGCQQPQAATEPGLGQESNTGEPANDKACADIAATADRVFFQFDSAELQPDARTTLDTLAAQIQEQPQCRFVVEGHCDERGTREYNLALGEKRASVVVNYLAALGVDPAHMQTASYGKERPAVIGDGEEIWAQNRRAVMVFK